MDLRVYIQEDMAEFLDNRLSVEYLKEQTTSSRIEDGSGFSRDFEAELFEALQRHDIYQAKKVLHDVRDLFSTYPVGSSERRQLEAILRSLYEKFKEYLETENTLNRLEEGISHVDDPTSFLEQDKQEITTLEQAVPTPQKEFSKEPSTQTTKPTTTLSSTKNKQPVSITKKVVEQSTKDLDLSIQSLKDAIMHKDKVFARKEYLRTKNFYEQLSTEQKKVYKEQIIVLYSQLTALISATHKPSPKKEALIQQVTPSQKKEILEEQDLTPSLLPQKKIEQKKSITAKKVFEEKDQVQKKEPELVHQQKVVLSPEKKKLYAIEKDLRQAISSGELHEAMLHYEELREIIHSLPQNQQHEHVSRAHTYYDWLMKAWHQYQVSHPTIHKHERRLTGKP